MTNIRVIADVSSVEVFVNDGEYVFSTRYYPDKYSINVQAEGADICLAEIK
ncbi:GH32 C-terminal domain-containing protein [[Ruminococcus] gnavus]|nr:GH32 C-terminal domain-containing protein [Mediterraneibacter gnavus]